MFRKSALAVAGALTLAALALVGVTVSNAYVGQNPFIVSVDGPRTSVLCDQTVTITVTLRRSETGQLEVGQTVRWSFSQARSPQDSIAPVRTITNGSGKASVQVRFGPVNGERIVRIAPTDEFPETLRVTCHGAPETPSRPTESPGPEPSAAVASTEPSPAVSSPGLATAIPSADTTASPTGVAPSPSGVDALPSSGTSSSPIPVAVVDTPAPSSAVPNAPAESAQPTAAPEAGAGAPAMDLLPIALLALGVLGLGLAGVLIFARR